VTSAVRSAGASGRRRWNSTGLWQAVLGLSILLVWEVSGRVGGSSWVSRPSLVAAKLADWAMGDLYVHVATTLGEIVIGMAIGVPLGAACGVMLGRSARWGTLLRPLLVAAYSVPLVTLAPILIMWFGLEMKPKIVLIAVVAFFLVFFNAFTGARAVDPDIVQCLKLMGATRYEINRKVVLPACSAWIMTGVKVAVPYALVAATTGEMLAARNGIGLLITRAAAQFDMTALYAALVILMVLGVLASKLVGSVEAHLLRWRHANR
jgi:NitT/TauT family transport system permease protein